MTTVIGYLRVSTREQGDSGAGLAAQRADIEHEAARRDWQVVWVTDIQSGRDLRREGLQDAFNLLTSGGASALVVAKLDRLSRSVQDFAATMARALREGWEIVALDLAIDTSTPAGRLVAHVLAAVAEWERDVIGQRTKDALAERKAAGQKLGGRAPIASPETMAIIRGLAETRRPAAIARLLAQEGLPTPTGKGVWRGSTVSRMLEADRRRRRAA